MKSLKTFTTSLLLLTTISLTAQQGINYKALIKDGGGNVVANQAIAVQFQILQGAGMINVYQETHTPNTDVNGIVMVNIGEGTTSDVFADVDWGSDDHYLNVHINTGDGLTDMGTTQFMAVPYALNAANAASKIDDLSDGRSDTDGNSLFLGVNAGLNDDGTDNRNVGIGFEALFSNSTGFVNTANGYQALLNNTEGSYNTANGYKALFSNISGSYNTANGLWSLQNNNTGYDNTASGYAALQQNTSGYKNAAFGFAALRNNTEGFYNTASGNYALNYNSTGINNTAQGFQAGFNSLGDLNVFIGSNSGYNEIGSNKLYIENSDADADNALIYGEFDTNILRTNSEFQIGNPTLTGYAFPTVDGTVDQILQTDGNGNLTWSGTTGVGATKIDELSDGYSKFDVDSSLFLGELAGQNDDRQDNHNMGIGYGALHFNTTGSGNLAIGELALVNNTGDGNTAIGQYSLLNNSEGNYNTAIGVQALDSNLTGDDNTATGFNALDDNTTGSNNTANGSGALTNNETGSDNTAIGYQALYLNTTGYGNTANGYEALYPNTDGDYNTGIGRWALRSNTSGNENTAIGNQALHSNTDGDYNTANGTSALRSNTSGNENTAIGYHALYSSATGSYNTAIGFLAIAQNGAGVGNTAIGHSALFNLFSGNNNIGIGRSAQVPIATGSNQVSIGNSLITSLSCMGAFNGSVGGTTRDVYVDSNGKIGYVSSSARYKNNIVSMENIDWIYKLKPVNYTYKNDEYNLKQYGLIAEEVEKINTALISYNNDGSVETVNYSKLIAPMLKALQEQKEIIEKQNTEIKSLTSELKAQSKSINQLLKRMQKIENATGIN